VKHLQGRQKLMYNIRIRVMRVLFSGATRRGNKTKDLTQLVEIKSLSMTERFFLSAQTASPKGYLGEKIITLDEFCLKREFPYEVWKLPFGIGFSKKIRE